MEDPDWEKKINFDDPKAYLRLKRKASLLADFELIKKRRQETKTLKLQENAQREIIETQRAMRRVYEAEHHLQMEAGTSGAIDAGISTPRTPATPNSSQSFDLPQRSNSNTSNSYHSLNSALRKFD